MIANDISSQIQRLPGITGVILAGGRSSRMGSNKALLPYRGGRFIEAIYRQLAELFHEVILVTGNPEQYDFLPCRKVADLYPGMGALAGIHAGLHHAGNPVAFVVACDMPCLNAGLIRHLAASAESGSVLMPESPAGVEPLHSFYGKGALPAIEATLRAGQRRIVAIAWMADVRTVPAREVARFAPAFSSFSNINTPQEYYRLRGNGRDDTASIAEGFASACSMG
ncbi:MAG TPA: molybdenum cofactor guanylyltransferase [Geobacteraceae bacterium]